MNAGIDHYIHHAKFRYNFGANPFWDRLFGTEYPQDKKELLMNQFYEEKAMYLRNGKICGVKLN